jgi:hypothetical protein
LNDEHERTEATEIIRGLIDRIVLTPKEEQGRQTLSIDLEGALAGVLALAANDKRPLTGSGLSVREITLVAGAHNHLCRTAMAWIRPCRRALLGPQRTCHGLASIGSS